MAHDSGACDRLFYSLPDNNKCESNLETEGGRKESEFLHFISKNIIGCDKVFSGPFGLRKELYLDYTASGKSLKFIEDYIVNEVLTEYGNTHTTTSVSSLQTTLYRHEARDIIRNAVNASEHDAVIFVGSGTTGAVHKLIHSLDLNHTPVVLVGPYEHHSNLLPWIESGAKVIRVSSDSRGLVDIQHLQALLQKWKSTGCQLIGCFSAASNVTGVLADVHAINVCLHKHGALAFWDYATAAPYVKVDMNPVSASTDQEYMYKDAVFISTHKFVGGVQTPGVLVAKKSLFRNQVPDGCGGGSVFFVRRDGHRYLQEPELKEEGGTPAIVEAIRAGLVFQLKQTVTPELILQREHYMLQKAKAAWQDSSSLVLLGNLDVEQLPIFSFLVYHEESHRYLHHNFVSTLLNDLFGIQSRGGCACAGPYAMDLLGMEEETSRQIEELLAEDSRLDRTHLRRYKEYSQREIIRPGFTRINLPYFLDDATLEFIIEAVQLVAEEGWRLLPQYMFNPETGEWRQVNFQVFKDRKWLGHISYKSGEMTYKVPPPVMKGPLPDSYQDCLQRARDLFTQACKTRYQLADHTMMFDDAAKPFRWFLLPSEAADCLRNQSTQNSSDLPFCPPQLRESLGLPVFVGSHDNGDCDITDFILNAEQESLCSCRNKCQTWRKSNRKKRKENASAETIERQNNYQNELKETSKVLSMGDSSGETHGGNMSLSEQRRAEVDGCGVIQTSDDEQEKTKTTSLNRSEMQGKQTVVCNINGEESEISYGSTDISLNSNTVHEDSRTTIKPTNKECVVINSADESTEGKVERVNLDKNIEAVSCPITKETRKRKTSGDRQQIEEAVKKSKEKSETDDGKRKKKDNKWFSPPKVIFAPFLKAVEEYSMFCDGDKVLVCLSGGKDSLSLLHTVRQYQFYSRKKGIRFELGAVTVDPQTPSYDPSPLKQYLASLDVPYFYESQGILEQASKLPYECASICSFCSRMKRGRIYACARREGYNVIALGQHLDDLCESFLMSIFHNGLLRTMKACYTVEEGDLRVIRPFVYVREKDLRSFAEKNKLPVIAENCPACFEAPKERHRTKQLLASQEIMFPQLFNSLMSAIKPIMAINKTGVKITDFLHQDTSQDDIDI